MIGAIAGDMVGSPYEGAPIKSVSSPIANTDNFVIQAR
jgi:hypothetical protein